MAKYRFVAECPRCDTTSLVETDDLDVRVRCGECLMNDVEIVAMTVRLIDKKMDTGTQ
jgi:ribosomal protein S27AE